MRKNIKWLVVYVKDTIDFGCVPLAKYFDIFMIVNVNVNLLFLISGIEKKEIWLLESPKKCIFNLICCYI